MANQRHVVLRGFLTETEQQELVKESIACHVRNEDKATDWDGVATSTSSLKFRLGIDCGESLEGCLPLATELSRKAFLRASEQMGGCKTLDDLGADAPLTGLVLLYGPKGSMSPHYDSPTQPGQRQEWLAMMTVGNPVDFVCNDQVLTLQSGDALVMDSMAVLHGVKAILPISGETARHKLPIEGSRLGVLLWQGKSIVGETSASIPTLEGGLENLFGDDEDSD